MLLTEGLSGFMLFGRMYWGSGFPCRYLQKYLLFSILQPMKDCVYLTALPSFWLPFIVELCTPSWNVVLIDCKIHPHSNFKWQSERNGARGAAGSLFIAIDRWTSNLVNSRSRSTFFVILCSAILQQKGIKEMNCDIHAPGTSPFSRVFWPSQPWPGLSCRLSCWFSWTSWPAVALLHLCSGLHSSP